jgi:hypothetical protein
MYFLDWFILGQNNGKLDFFTSEILRNIIMMLVVICLSVGLFHTSL